MFLKVYQFTEPQQLQSAQRKEEEEEKKKHHTHTHRHTLKPQLHKMQYTLMLTLTTLIHNNQLRGT